MILIKSDFDFCWKASLNDQGPSPLNFKTETFKDFFNCLSTYWFWNEFFPNFFYCFEIELALFY